MSFVLLKSYKAITIEKSRITHTIHDFKINLVINRAANEKCSDLP